MERQQTFASWLKQQRKALDLTQSNLARLVGCALITLQKIEEGRRRPSKQVAELLAHHLRIAPDARDDFLRRARTDPLVSRSTPSTPVSHMHVPIPPTPLIGRAQEMEQIGALLRTPAVHLVTLTGAGGIGKTRLGVEVVVGLRADFPNGVYFVDLAPIREPTLVISAIAQTLGIKETGGQPLMNQLKQFLSNKRLLLLLDNFEQVLDAAPLLAEVLSTAPQLKLLVTSRQHLHLRGEKEVAVMPLALPDRADLPPVDQLSQYAAVTLFLERVSDANPSFQHWIRASPLLGHTFRPSICFNERTSVRDKRMLHGVHSGTDPISQGVVRASGRCDE